MNINENTSILFPKNKIWQLSCLFVTFVEIIHAVASSKMVERIFSRNTLLDVEK